MSRLSCCFNWRVYAGLGGVALGVLVLAPGAFWGVLPFLVVAACPISMFLMMRGMEGGRCAAEPGTGGTGQTRPAPPALGRDERLAALVDRLASVRAQQEALAAEVARLEAADAPAVREAEAVARAAAERAERQS